MSSPDRDGDPRPGLTRRMAEVWRAQRPSEIDVARARRRFALGRAGAKSRARVRPLAWVLAITFGAGSVLAAGGLIVRPWLETRDESREQSKPAPAQGRAEHAAPVSRTELPEKADISAVVEVPPLDEAAAPAPAPSVAPRAAPVPTQVKEAAVEDRPVEYTASGAWTRAAEALRQGDDEAARRALGEVMTTGSRSERDAAALLEAQLLVQRGRFEQAAPRLRELAESGATATIRRQAGELLSR